MKSKTWLSFSLILVLSGIGLSQKAAKTVTNLDLEKYKQRREKAEADYRANYKKLGMPSPEELERRNAESSRELEAISQRLQYEKQEKQSYWMTQANYLRNQIINADAQINYLNGLIGNTPAQNSIFLGPQDFNSVTVVSGYGYGRGYGGGFYNNRRGNTVNPANNVQTVINAASANPNPFYGTPLQNNGVKVVIGQPNSTRQRVYRGPFFGGGYVLPYAINNGNLRRDEMIANLQYLVQVRAGLMAQWNNLVDEAHRAGVKID